MTLTERVMQRFKEASWRPWSDPAWKDEGFTISLTIDGQNIGTATMSKPKPTHPDTWLCRVSFGGGLPVVGAEGKTPAQAAEIAREKLKKAIAVIR